MTATARDRVLIDLSFHTVRIRRPSGSRNRWADATKKVEGDLRDDDLGKNAEATALYLWANDNRAGAGSTPRRASAMPTLTECHPGSASPIPVADGPHLARECRDC